MNKEEFLAQLRQGLAGLPQQEREERVLFYSEMIDDGIEEGLPEAEAVARLGPVQEVVAQILADIPLTKLVKEKVKCNKSLKAWEIVLIVLGSPVWLALLIAAFAVVLAGYVVLWAVVIALWSVWVALAACSLGMVVSAVAAAVWGGRFTGLVLLGAGMVCAGLTIFMFFGCKAADKGILWLTKKIAIGIKTLLMGKGIQHE